MLNLFIHSYIKYMWFKIEFVVDNIFNQARAHLLAQRNMVPRISISN